MVMISDKYIYQTDNAKEYISIYQTPLLKVLLFTGIFENKTDCFFVFMMHCLRAIYFIVLVLFNIVGTKGLLAHGTTNTSDPIHGSSGHIIDTAEIKQILLNQTNELENLRREAENDRSKIQSLQNRVFVLEAELTKLNASKPTQEMSTYLLSMDKLIQNMATNEENDRNLTERFDAFLKHFNDLSVQVRYTSLSLLDIHALTEELNGSLIQRFEKRINDEHDHIASMIQNFNYAYTSS